VSRADKAGWIFVPEHCLRKPGIARVLGLRAWGCREYDRRPFPSKEKLPCDPF
jgi:hypothetical protein